MKEFCKLAEINDKARKILEEQEIQVKDLYKYTKADFKELREMGMLFQPLHRIQKYVKYSGGKVVDKRQRGGPMIGVVNGKVVDNRQHIDICDGPMIGVIQGNFIDDRTQTSSGQSYERRYMEVSDENSRITMICGGKKSHTVEN